MTKDWYRDYAVLSKADIEEWRTAVRTEFERYERATSAVDIEDIDAVVDEAEKALQKKIPDRGDKTIEATMNEFVRDISIFDMVIMYTLAFPNESPFNLEKGREHYYSDN